MYDDCGSCGGEGYFNDSGLLPNGDCDCEGNILSISKSNVPQVFSLNKIYPNPFNPVTTVNYSIAQLTTLNFSIYNILGEKIITLYNGMQQPGYHTIHWNASERSSGIYFLKMEVDEYIQIKKMILIK